MTPYINGCLQNPGSEARPNSGHLTFILQNRLKYADAETMFRRVVEGREKVLGRNHPDTVTGADNLAIVLRHQGKFAEGRRNCLDD